MGNTPWGTAPRPSRNERKLFMRSDLIYGALAHISNRYQLCQLASKATRKLHKPNTRLQDTTNEVLVRFHQTSPMGMQACQPLPPQSKFRSSAAQLKRGRSLRRAIVI